MKRDNREASFPPAAPENCYILFPSHTDGWRLYELARDAGLRTRVSPTPRAARASCGVSLLVASEDAERVIALATAECVPVEGVARLPCQIDARRDQFC